MKSSCLHAIVPGAVLAVVAVSGAAFAGPSENVIFHANLDEHGQYNDVWGYTAPNGDEYALLGVVDGLAVINVSDPANPYETAFLSGPTSTWRDIKTYDHYAYVTNESSGGLTIVDLDDPENPQELSPYTGFSSAHNLYIDEASARCFIAGSNLSTGGARILSLANPTNPVQVGSWEVNYLHDIYVKGDRLYGSAINDDRLVILDISNLGSISIVGTISGYPAAFTHNAWTTANQDYVMTTDETSSSSTRMWDITTESSAVQTDSYRPNNSTIPHNAHIEGDFAYISYYTLGVKVLDISDPFNLTEVGSYDTWPANDNSNFDGCWGAFPFFGTTPGLLVASDLSTGLYVLEYKGPLGTLSGEITKTGEPAVKITHASIEIMETGVSASADGTGSYSIQDVAGSVTVEVTAFGYATKQVPATITANVTSTLDVALDALPGGTISGTVRDNVTTSPLVGATIEVLASPLSESADAGGNYTHGSVPVGTHTVRASAFGYNPKEVEITMSDGLNLLLDFDLNGALAADDFEAADAGWTLSGSVTTGAWQRANPEGTAGGTVQPEDDHTPAPGVNCWVTQAAAGSGVGSFDIDGGTTRLTSPTYDLSTTTKPRASYWRWYVSGYSTNPTTDFWTVEVSDDNGSNWTVIENTDSATPAWVNIDVDLDALITLTNQVKFRFSARDTGQGSITEAALDDFFIYEIEEMANPGTGLPGPLAGSRALVLGQNFPNPFRAGQSTTFAFSNASPGPVRATVYDVAGRLVATIHDGRLDAGTHRLVWDGRERAGGLTPAGIYFVKVSTQDGERTRKVLVIR